MTEESGESRAHECEGDSVALILEFAREQYAQTDKRHQSLVTRSATYLGFLAVLIGLVAAAPFRDTAWRVFSVFGLVVLVVAIVLFVRVTRLETYTATPDTAGLIDGYLHRPEGDTRRQVLSNTRQALKDNEATLKTVGVAYQLAATFAGLGTVLVAVGVAVELIAA